MLRHPNMGANQMKILFLLSAVLALSADADDASPKPTNAIDNVYCAGSDKVMRFLANILDEV